MKKRKWVRGKALKIATELRAFQSGDLLKCGHCSNIHRIKTIGHPIVVFDVCPMWFDAHLRPVGW